MEVDLQRNCINRYKQKKVWSLHSDGLLIVIPTRQKRRKKREKKPCVAIHSDESCLSSSFCIHLAAYYFREGRVKRSGSAIFLLRGIILHGAISTE